MDLETSKRNWLVELSILTLTFLVYVQKITEILYDKANKPFKFLKIENKISKSILKQTRSQDRLLHFGWFVGDEETNYQTLFYGVWLGDMTSHWQFVSS